MGSQAAGNSAGGMASGTTPEGGNDGGISRGMGYECRF